MAEGKLKEDILFYTKTAAETEKLLESSAENGLSKKEAEKRLRQNGKNLIEENKSRSFLFKFISQFKDLMIIILFIAAAVSFLLGYLNGEKHNAEPFIILIIVVINGLIGAFQEHKAEKSIEALKKLTAPKAMVIRDGIKQEVNAAELAVGDLVFIKSGDIAPADLRLSESVELVCEEASLTGEANEIYKSEKDVLIEGTGIAGRSNCVFMGSNILSGYARAFVIKVGMNTEIGKIASMIKDEEAPASPLKRKLEYTSKHLALITVVICIIIFVLGVLRGANALNMLMISISLAVAAIPEGLTALISIVLSMGVKRMANNKAIIRKPQSVETLGSTTVICTDKTGTLTQNKMHLTAVTDAFSSLEKNDNERKWIISLASLCNDSEVDSLGKVSGSPTEKAIMKAYIDECPKDGIKYERIGEIPFTSKRKMMSTVHINGEAYLVASKGTPEVILNKCTAFYDKGKIKALDSFALKRIRSINKDMANKALRVLAVAEKNINSVNISDEEIESNLIFRGFIGIEDPPRKEALSAVKSCRKAGIKPVMITGDQSHTAAEIAKRTGIWQKENKIMKGSELNKISTEKLSEIINDYSVFSEVSPTDKMKIVKAFQINGETVAMTGDGVNDAPALKCADIGCAMGKNGTEVAKGASDMILTDDNFASIVKAVEEGRNIFINIKNTVHFLISSNIGEVFLVFAAFLCNLPQPILPIQLLWVNLVTDSFPALAIGTQKSDESNMDSSFLKNNRQLLTKSSWLSIFIEGIFIGSLSLLAFSIGRYLYDIAPYEPFIGRTMAFAVLSFSQLVHAYAVKSEKSIFKGIKNKALFKSSILCALLMVSVINVPLFSDFFGTCPLNFMQWSIVALLSFCPLLVSEAEKLIKSKKISEG